MTSLILFLLGWFSLGFSLPLLAQGYTIEGNRIVVEGEEQWKAWSYPKGTLTFEDDGSFHPVYIRKNINACVNARDFTYGYDNGIRGGIADVGSNAEDAGNVMDGDPMTYWEPGRDDSVNDWWIRVDLGRLVWVEKIVIRFGGGRYSDPFLAFKIRTSAWDRLQQEMDWQTMGSVTNTDLSQHVFEFRPVREKCRYTEIQCVELRVMGSRGDRTEEISEEEYESLDMELRGAVVHYRITPTGEEEWLDEEAYEKLPPDQRGPIRYYRREAPRLAEIEVWAEGDNLCVGAVKRGGSVDMPVLIDGLFGTFAIANTRWTPEADIQVDLGALLWIDSVRLVSSVWGVEGHRADIPRCYLWRSDIGILTSDGGRAADGSLLWEPVVDIGAGELASVHLQDSYKARHVKLRFFSKYGTGEYGRVHEMQLYGEGYVPEVKIVSPIIEVGEHKSLTSLQWDAEMPTGTNVEIRTRTGNTLREEIHYFDAGGNEVSSHEYHKLPFFKQGEVVTRMVPGDDWSMWSYPASFPEDHISSPSPRKYLQIQARLLSDDPEAHAMLRSMAVSFFSPLVQQIVGEVYPTQAERAGQQQDFSLYLRPSFTSTNMGFDEILLYSPSHAQTGFRSLHIGSEEEYVEDQEDTFTLEDVEIRPTGSDSAWIRLPYPVEPGREDLVRIDFSSTIYLNGTVFAANIVHSSAPDSPQRVDAGDATSSVPSEEMTVFVPVEERVIGDVEISPDPFTPNADGVNDEVMISFSVFKAYLSVPVRVEIWDLGGKKVWKMEERRDVGSGRYDMVWDGSAVWDGRDEYGRKVQPGIYVVRIRVKDRSFEDAEDAVVTRTVSVVY